MWQIVFMFVFVSQHLFYCAAKHQGEDRAYWDTLGSSDIEEALLTLKTNNGVAKNVILFIGDGMGPNTVTSARIYGKSESGHLVFEKFPHTGSLKTFNADKLVPDSASTATALYAGIKTNYRTVGVANVSMDDCVASLKPENRPENIFDWAVRANKNTGFVTTTRVTHATPASLYAHSASRKWECDVTMPPEANQCKDIARQLIEDNPHIKVIMGGGRQCLQSHVTGSEADPIDTWACLSTDGRNLIEHWKNDKIAEGVKYSLVQNNAELEQVRSDTNYLLGIFANSHLKYDYERDPGPNGMPSLAEMTEKAIEVLKKKQAGFILMVEGGLIDYGHHRGQARKALDETIAFDEAIEKALELMQDEIDETLIIVTADHSHSDVFTGYSDRGKSILDIAGISVMDNIPYTSLQYANGGPENFQYEIINNEVKRKNPAMENTKDFEYSQQAAVLSDEVHHSGVDVMVYAKGPMAHLFHRLHDQTYVPHVIAYSARIGPYSDRPIHNSSIRNTGICNLWILIVVVSLFI